MRRALQALIREYQETTGEKLPILDKKLDDKDKRASRKRKKYQTDEEYRQSCIDKTKAWNAAHPEKKRKNDQRWAKKNGAAAARAYRRRKKAKLKEKRK